MLTLKTINIIIDDKIKIYKKSNIENSIREFFKKNKNLEKNSVILSMIYFKKFIDNGGNVNDKNLLDILLTCIVLSNKILLDEEVKGTTKNEIIFLKTLNWSLFVGDEEYFNFIQNYRFLL